MDIVAIRYNDEWNIHASAVAKSLISVFGGEPLGTLLCFDQELRFGLAAFDQEIHIARCIPISPLHWGFEVDVLLGLIATTPKVRQKPLDYGLRLRPDAAHRVPSPCSLIVRPQQSTSIAKAAPLSSTSSRPKSLWFRLGYFKPHE